MSLGKPVVTRTRPLLILLVGINVLLTVWRSAHAAMPIIKSIGHRVHLYGFTGTDFPPRHPFLGLKPASLTLQETVRYGDNASDPATSMEWDTLVRYPHGLGRAILGPDRRELLVTFYHQLHCIREVQKGLLNHDDSEATPHHMKHCMDYLRQTILCSAVDTLEKGDFMQRDWERQRTGGDMMCWDWELVFQGLDDGWSDFIAWRDGVL